MTLVILSERSAKSNQGSCSKFQYPVRGTVVLFQGVEPVNSYIEGYALSRLGITMRKLTTPTHLDIFMLDCVPTT